MHRASALRHCQITDIQCPSVFAYIEENPAVCDYEQSLNFKPVPGTLDNYTHQCSEKQLHLNHFRVPLRNARNLIHSLGHRIKQSCLLKNDI